MISIRHCFVRDESSHWYCIPIELKEEFNRLNENEQWQDFEDKFYQYRLAMHPSNYSFENLKEL